jgi:hypothetical protein
MTPSSPLEITVVFDSCVEQVFAFKTCCGAKAFDQNLEIRIRNHGDRAVTLLSSLDLEADDGPPERIDYLMPNGPLLVGPGEIRAFYCTMDEARWKKARRLVLRDSEGTRYPVEVQH